ncbi:MAG: monovalent cation/H(+) antiporter subunit G [Pseudorhizobium sp.]
MLPILSILFKLAGVAFLCIAALGVIRLPDPFQRMHAATKAGTLGAGLVIIGSVIAHGAVDATIMGIFTVVFLLLTVPVAGHLLGRAAYVSGARLALSGDDALAGVLPRAGQSLGERGAWTVPAMDEPKTGKAPTPTPLPASLQPPRARKARMRALPAIDTVRFAVIDGHVRPVTERASAIAEKSGASLRAYVMIDTQAIKSAADEAQMRRLIRERASAAIGDLKAITAQAEIAPILNYDEGDPEHILRCDAKPGETLLVLPCKGWFHHQVEARLELTTWEPDGLLRLPDCHRGPVLFVADEPLPETARTLVVRDCGEEHLIPLVEWALLTGLWDVTTLVHVADEKARQPELAEIAQRFGCRYVQLAAKGDACAIPPDIDGVRAVVLGRTPRPMRTHWYGSHWRSRIAPNMAGDVLIMEADAGPRP